MRARPASAALPALLVAVLAAGALPGCSRDEPPPAYALPSEKVREGERVLHGRAGRSADLQVTVLAFSDPLTSLFGSHAEMRPKGRYVRVRIMAVNTGRDIQVFDTWKQLLVTADGRTLVPDVNATMVKRQPERLSVGAAMRAEFDLYYDVPQGVGARALRVVGSPTVGAVSQPDPADIPLT
ncbi:DUF4352 domain-containing protein [Actinomadura kijaniata]|uniref:DUF4352 domain-containing protein n=1 Tax=Actinomadura kijaniata TaxID=46161 RepID=UPI00083063B4|nr:DUF4352 domain-containing protein [Actinomadura kijaniata]